MAAERSIDSTLQPTRNVSQTDARWTRLPILLGVLAGMISWIVLASFESPAFYGISVRIFGERSPKGLFAKPGYYCVHRTILLTLCLVGGTIGSMFSTMRRRNSIAFVAGLLAIIALFAAMYPR